MIELYIENRKIDIAEDLEIDFTYESIDPDKLSSIKNSFSKTVNIPGTPNNNITFGHIFRFDKYIPFAGPTNINSYYDPHKKVNWFINKNGSLVNRGYCTLDNILVKSERNITYQLTLYGGIGEFFYSLSYNEDGSAKTLADMYWNWYPKIGLIGNGAQTTPTDENSRTLYKCSANIVASSYHNLNPLYKYEGTTNIDKDIVFVPCYTGLYENFDSKHMLVSTFNQHYDAANTYVSAETKSKLLNSFPDTYTEGDETYTTIGRTFSSTDNYVYGLATFSRDLDPWEAGDLRINELPVAVRLSKLLNVISQPYNNGGYDVIWDDEIKNSYHWLYSWVMLGKLKQENEDFNFVTFLPNTQYDGQHTTLNLNWKNGNATTISDATPYFLARNTGLVKKGNYILKLNVLPNLTFKFYSFIDFFSERYPDYISGSMNDFNDGSFRYVWTTPVLVHKIYDGNTLIKTIADIFYFSTKPSVYYFGYNNNRANINDIKNVLNDKIKQRFMGQGEEIDEFNYHICKLENPEFTNDGVNDIIKFNCSNEKIVTNLNFTNISSDITDFRVEQMQGVMWTNLSNITAITSGLYGTDNINFEIITPSSRPFYYSLESIYGVIFGDYDTRGYFSIYGGREDNSFVYFNLNNNRQNGLLSTLSSGFNIINLDKKTLFAESQSPMKYLSGFCKLMNYRFICDEASKKIYIKTLKNYYLNKTINIDDRVDIGRDINIKNIITKYKTINVGLDTPETYPTYIFNKISRDKFNVKRYETGIEYNAGETSLLNDLTYKNLIDWQQSSVYYNLNPQFPRAYDVQSISWTLFNQEESNIENIKKKEIFTVGSPSTSTSQLSAKDFLPKISIFNKENKSVDFESSLIFLNGFVKNYDYTQVGDNYIISPRVSFSNDMYEQYYLNQERCYMYNFKYNDNFVSWGCYSSDQKGTASSWLLPMFTRDLYNSFDSTNGWTPSSYKLASWNLVNQEGLDNQYSLSNTDFIYNSNYNYTKTVTSTSYTSNEYKIEEVPQDDEEYTDRIYDKNWKDYLNDLYDRNTRDITAYVDLSGLGNANSIMRNFYQYKSNLFIITKLENFKISETTHDKFTKVKLHKIKNKDTWTNLS